MPPARPPLRPPAPVGVIQSSKRPQPKGELLLELARLLQLRVLPILNHLTVEGASMKRLQPVILSMWTCPLMRICLAAINLYVALIRLRTLYW
jgi:hypothetical protein